MSNTSSPNLPVDEIREALTENVVSLREWLDEQPDIKRIVIEQANGVRIRIGRKKVDVKTPDGGGVWHDLSKQFPPEAKA